MEPEIVVDGIPQIPEAARKIPLGGSKNDTITITEDAVYTGVAPELALRIFGYDTCDLQAAINAFELHFVQKDIDGKLSDEDLKILNNLYKKYM
jgi:N-acetylmuramoyl-L-alanine amidase